MGVHRFDNKVGAVVLKPPLLNMDPTAYRDFKTSRAFNYHYFFSAPKDPSIPTLFFCHGFPSTSYDWHRQVDFFRKEGYGLVVPDMLGYGGTDKPETAESYRMSLMAQDMVDIVDREKIENVVVIGHDWGAALTSKLAYYHRERFSGFGMLASAYMPPNPNFNYTELVAITEKVFGYALVGYWEFFSSSGAPKIIKDHINSFYNLLFPSDPLLWKEHLVPLGTARQWVYSDRMEGEVSYLSEEELERHKHNLLQGGLAAPLCWYRAMVYDHTPGEERDIGIDPDRLVVEKPVFFGATLRDYICLAEGGKAATRKFCPNSRIVDFDTDHWVLWSASDKLNAELLDWIKTDVEGTAKKSSLY